MIGPLQAISLFPVGTCEKEEVCMVMSNNDYSLGLCYLYQYFMQYSFTLSLSFFISLKIK